MWKRTRCARGWSISATASHLIRDRKTVRSYLVELAFGEPGFGGLQLGPTVDAMLSAVDEVLRQMIPFAAKAPENTAIG